MHFVRLRRRWLAALFAILAIAAMTGCASVLGNLAAKMLTGKTADLSQVSAIARFIRNTYPAETQTTEVKYSGALWVPGSNVAAIQFLKREGIGMFSIDGTVSLNGEELPHIANGVYGKVLDDNEQPQTFEILTLTGQTASLTVVPTAPIAIKSINGSLEGAEIDMTQDLVLELDNPAGSAGTPLRVALLADAVRTRAFYDLGIFSARDRLVIPAAAFRHSAPPNAKFFTFNKGANYLLVERFQASLSDDPALGAGQIIAQSWDTVPVTLSGDVDVIDRVEVQGEIAGEGGSMEYSMNVPNASYGRPFSSGQRFALASLSVRGTLRKEISTSWSTTSGNVTTTTTRTQTWQFPQLSDAFWDQLLENMNKDITALLRRRYGIDIIPVEQVVAAPSYAALEAVKDENTQVEVERSYRGTKNLIPTSLSALAGNISSTFAADRPDSRLMHELGVDGLISVTLDLDVPTDTDKITLRPVMSIRVTGPPNGYQIGPTVYAEGLASSPRGVSFSEAELQDINALNRIVRKDDLMRALTQALDELEAKERELGYQAIWALK